MASKGRNGDSMLVHMTPGEVHGLQALAMKHGGSLTVNPDTGLPEANFLKSLLPMLAGFALGPAGFGLVSSGLTAGAIVGGVTGLATGSLSKGLMAGLGAYGGFGIGESLAGLGAGELAQGQISANMPTLAEGATQTQIADYAKQVNDLRTAGLQSASQLPMADKLSAGFSSATASPMDAFNFAKDNKMALGMAAAPIMADMMVPTTTKSAPVQSPGRIVEKRWNGREFVPVASTDASVFNTSGRTFSDPYRGYNNGGIVALAEGGAVPGYAVGGAMPNMREWMDKTGITDPTEASNLLYGVVGSNKDTRDWGSIMSSADPVAAAKAATSQMYTSPTGNAGYVKLDDTGTSGMLYSGSGVPLTSDLSRADEFGISYTPQAATGLAALNTAATNTAATNTAATNTAATNTAATNTAATNTQAGGAGLAALNTAATTPYYFQVNQDVANEYARNPMGLTPDQFAQAHYTNFGQKEGREFEPSAAVKYATANKTDIVANTLKWIDDHAFATPDQITTAIKGSGMSQGDVNRTLDSLVASGKITAAERYYIQQGKGLSGMAEQSAKWLKDNPDATQTQINAVLGTAEMDTTDAQRMLAHGFQVAEDQMAAATKYIQDNPDVARWITSDQGKAYIKDHPEFDAKDIAFTHYERYGKKEGRKWGAETVVPPIVPPVVPPVVVPPINATQNTITGVGVPTDLYTAPASSLPVGVSGNTGPSQIGGGATINPNGTITTSPRIPGIPVGGFTGMQNLRDVYTKGGGSLGYTSPTYTADQFEEKYVKRLSGDSKAAYDYLSGKGGAKYPTKSGVGQISEDYATAVLGYPARGNLPYIYNKATGRMDVNPDYVAPGRDSAGNVTYSMSLNDIKSSLKETPLSGQALYDWAQSNNLSAQQIADATGRSLSSVYSDFRAGSKAKADTDKATDVAKGGDTIQVTDSSGYNTETVTATKQADGTYLGSNGKKYDAAGKPIMAGGGITGYAAGGMPSYALGGLGTLGGYSDGGRLLKGPGDGVSDSIPATIGRKQQPARLADGEFVIPARIVSELGNGSTDAGAKKLYAMLDRVQRARGKTTGKNKVAANSRADKYLPA
jgi:hypothetical protein